MKTLKEIEIEEKINKILNTFFINQTLALECLFEFFLKQALTEIMPDKETIWYLGTEYSIGERKGFEKYEQILQQNIKTFFGELDETKN
jgi:hypothetical protein